MRKRTNKYISLSIIALSAVVLMIGGGLAFGLSNNSGASAAPEKHSEKEIAGSIIITENKKRAIAQAEESGLRPAFVNDNIGLPGKTIIEFAEDPSHPRVRALGEKLDGTIVPNYVYATLLTPNDPKYSDQWNMPKISAPEAWDVATGSDDVVIAVIDTGILFEQIIDGTSYNQPDFPDSRKWINPAESGMTALGDACYDTIAGPEDKRFNDCDDSGNGLIDDWQGWDFMGGFRGDSEVCPNHSDSSEYESSDIPDFIAQDNDPQPYSCDSPNDPNILNKYHYDDGICEAFVSACYVGHGTMVASVAAAQTNNNELIAGIDHQAKIMNIRVLDGYGWGTTSRLVGGIHYAAENGADVINMSLGSNCHDESFSDPLVESALQAAADAGVVSVAASGNRSSDTICYPASSSHVMAIGATNPSDNRLSYSNYSDKLDVVAPAGVPVANAPSAQRNSDYHDDAHGTSLSTPHAAGLAALIRGVNPDSSRQEVRGIINTTADKVPNMGGQNKTKQYGYGRINAHRALRMATSGTYEKIHFFTCDSQKYLVESNIRRKRIVPESTISHWGFHEVMFTPGSTQRCGYPTYNLALDTLIRSRDTGNVYLIIDRVAYRLDNQDVADTWGIYNYETSTYPQFNGVSIHVLEVGPTLEPFSPSIGGSNLVLFRCDDERYLVERNRRKKRPVTQAGLEAWGLAAYFGPGSTQRCGYPTYNLALDTLIRSRNTKRVYLTDNVNAWQIRNLAAANAWGLGNVFAQTYPQFDGPSIHFLNVEYDVPRLATSTNQARSDVYVVDNGNRHTIAGTPGGETESLQLIRGDDGVPMEIFSVTLLQTLTSTGEIDYSFQSGGSWYLFDYNRTRKIASSSEPRWEDYLSGPDLSSSFLGIFDENADMENTWRTGADPGDYYYRLISEGELQRTTDPATAEEWNVDMDFFITELLTNKLIVVKGVTEH